MYCDYWIKRECFKCASQAEILCYYKPVTVLNKKLYVTGKKEMAIRNKDPSEMGQMILNSVPAAMVPHSEGSSTVLSWLQTANAAGALFLAITIYVWKGNWC